MLCMCAGALLFFVSCWASDVSPDARSIDQAIQDTPKDFRQASLDFIDKRLQEPGTQLAAVTQDMVTLVNGEETLNINRDGFVTSVCENASGVYRRMHWHLYSKDIYYLDDKINGVKVHISPQNAGRYLFEVGSPRREMDLLRMSMSGNPPHDDPEQS